MHNRTQDWRSDSKAETKQQSSTGGANPRFARRRFLGAGAALMGSAVLAGYNQVADASHTSSPSDPLPNNVVPGTIERIVMPDTLYVRNSEGSKTIELSENAEFHRARAGAASGLDDFFVGDEIVAEGQWSGDVFAATALVQMLRLVEGPVLDRNGDKLQTV